MSTEELEQQLAAANARITELTEMVEYPLYYNHELENCKAGSARLLKYCEQLQAQLPEGDIMKLGMEAVEQMVSESSRISALEQQLSELKRDKERLEWYMLLRGFTRDDLDSAMQKEKP